MLLKLTKHSDNLSIWVNPNQIATLYNSGVNPNGCTITMANGNSHQVAEPVSEIAEALGGAICIGEEMETPPKTIDHHPV